MKKTIILLTKSRKHGGYCTSGIDVKNGRWVRIVSDGVGCNHDEIPYNQLICDNGEEAKIFDILEVECDSYKPTYFQPENYVKNRNIAWKKIGQSNLNEVIRLHPYEEKDYIYYNNDYRVDDSYIQTLPSGQTYSLMLIQVTNPTIEVKTWETGKKSVTFSFYYNNSYYRYIRSTSGFEQQFLALNDGTYIISGVFSFVISLGETYSRDLNHYKLIASVL